VQYWLLDYFLWRLPVHESCHSYQKERSILTNASLHVARAYVSNIDIENFFGSIDANMVREMLNRHGFGRQFSHAISRLVTLANGLPQGAPTSPVISNSFLYEFDKALTHFAAANRLVYTRYADDITISGEERKAVIKAIKYAEKLLRELGLRLNDKKTRIASQGGQQKVTGLVVNTKPQPPRKLRRRIRAMFHQADLKPEQHKDRKSKLQGYLSYLQSFPALENSDELKAYKRVIRKLKP
jgi:retron-type reverse transcriptase